jgi:hypothetical protein
MQVLTAERERLAMLRCAEWHWGFIPAIAMFSTCIIRLWPQAFRIDAGCCSLRSTALQYTIIKGDGTNDDVDTDSCQKGDQTRNKNVR